MDTKTLIELIEKFVDSEKSGEVKETVREELQNTELSVIDRAIINAYLLQQDGKIEGAIEKWHSIANITEGIENEIAAYAWFSIASLLTQDDQKEEALSAYDKSLNLNPNYAVTYNDRGATKSLLGQFESAISDYDEAIRLKPDYADAYYNRGGAKNELKQYEPAIADYDEAIRLEPDHADAYYNRGIAKGELKQYEAAIADYDEAIRLKPDYTDAYYNRGTAKNEIYHHEAAL